MNTIITIGREFGSGGREFGRRLAEELVKVFKHKHRNKAFNYLATYEVFKAIPEYNEWIKRMIGVFNKISTIDAFAMLYYMMDKIPANLPFSKSEVLEMQNVIKAVKALENNRVDRLMVFETKPETLLAANYILKNISKKYKNQAHIIKKYYKTAYIKDRSELNFKTEDLIKLLQGETGPKIGLIMNILIKKVVLGDAKNNFSMLKQEAVKLLLNTELELENIYNNIGKEEVKKPNQEVVEEEVELTEEQQEELRLQKLQESYNKELKEIYYTLLKYITSYDSLNIEDQKIVEKETLEKVIEARNQYVAASGSVEGSAKAEGMLEGAISKLFALAESYPELKSDEAFLKLQKTYKR